ncbi:TetR/AcrR family transcriptional regulator [Nakamurella flavida]|uniref:TetR/AcrR family transcriptional regulator n=1 Tax=Nakamurella flavida TaxID=363630 RepID=A0A938YMK6_9ACTN|nr:TetR/AcrR family transcriptional regulator [Nakamurella flavida]MBM9478014.1 TetR/AcrR family transcriptional regulator [Nakamurella flavida]MDP9778269.1 AcrR family transcriptional regulator [Nakamurella flavida]
MTADASTDAGPRPLRADAERNRRLILQVAAQVFAEKGLDAGFDEIARRAGVGAGTVYRRFPHRDQLIEALLADRLDELAGLAERAVENPDAWVGLVEFLDRSIGLQIEDRGLRESMEVSGRWSECSVDLKGRLVRALRLVLARAQEQGRVRPDVGITDLGVIATMVSSVHDPEQPELWRRYLAVFLDGLCTRRDDPTPLPLAAPSEHFYTRFRD